MRKNKLIERTNPGVHKNVISLIPSNPGKILDVGCGTGALLAAINKRCPESKLYGCDLEDQLSTFRDAEFKFSDFNKGLEFEDNSFNLITCIEVIEHLENPFFLIRELHRILKANGTLIMSSPNVENIFSKILYFLTGKFVHFFSKTDLDMKTQNHITPIFWWKWNMMTEDYFKIGRVKYNRGNVPFINIPLPKCSLTGEVRIIRFKKK